MKKLYIYIFGILSILLTSCGSDFLKEYSQDLARVQSVDDLQELLVGDCLMPKGYYGIDNSNLKIENYNYIILHFMSDELQENTQITEDPTGDKTFRDLMFPYFTWQQNVFLDKNGKSTYDTDEDNYWTLAYTAINNCNMVLDGIEQFDAKSDTDRERLKRLKGEALYLRATYYLTLVNLYGKPYTPSSASTELGIPVKLTPNVENRDFQRATVAKVYEQIVSDLAQAETFLQDAAEPQSIYHPGIEAVYITRSRVALYMQDWQTAVDYAKKALDKDDYLMDFSTLGEDEYPLSKKNKEVVFSNGSSCFGNIIFAKPKKTSWEDCSPRWIVSEDLYRLYDDKDYRKTTYITTEDDVTNNLPTYHKIDNSVDSYGKYKDVSDVFAVRTAEAYLNMAEAEAELGNDGDACTWLNKLRQTRIQDGGAVQLSGADLISFIRDERERELCFEGHRWFDLRRYMVDEKYPYTKEIIHSMTYFVNRHYTDVPHRIDRYKLELNDGAYTLDIPKKEKDFQPSLGSNIRPARPIYRSDDVKDDGGDDDY